MEANLFAAELLMPQRFLKEDLKDFGKLDLLDDQKMESLAAKYGVSNQAMAVRLNYLGYLAI
jgi:Zn-dependent peptidase ImmA (M78 family)